MSDFTQCMLDRYAKDVKLATTAPFLEKCGKHEISTEVLSDYLTQDKIYAFEGYPKFIAQLITRLPLSSPSSRENLTLFSFALQNVVRETGFFDSLGDRFGLNVHQPVSHLRTKNSQKKDDAESVAGSRLNENTKAYVDFLIATGAEGNLDEGIVLLWAMERLYFMAWTHAGEQTPFDAPSASSSSEPIKVALTELINNWTCDEFEIFVSDCEKAVGRLNLKEGSEEWKRCEETFKRVVYLEKRFWPSI
ncbi:Thiaminase-2/PQQC [Phaffia rhodozyma]|uniref:Thiaminase-2/PQQC n=1 Tax=Phaffia rhodozyma TaxID=264483 RepID=A0A0F7SLL6_PHARH|nr:Thiaminase-2/PQQC [Phaffia rhodozyma]